MRYFKGHDEFIAPKRGRYIEFLIESGCETSGGRDSIYMPEKTIITSGFCEFWIDCIHKDIVFGPDSLSYNELIQMRDEASNLNTEISAILDEIICWLEQHSSDNPNYVAVIFESDRVLERRRTLRDNYSVSPEFYQEVKAVDNSLSFESQQEEYERLLQKYNMPSSFFPFPLYNQDNLE